MSRLFRIASFAVVLGLAAALGACSSSSSSGPACAAYVVPAGTDLTKPAVSFKTDVMPIFTKSCGFSSCHGIEKGSNQGVFLGSQLTPNDASKIRGDLVAAPGASRGHEIDTMPFVTPGDPAKSYLMRKMDGDQCMLDAQCTGGSCQASMPQSSDLLDVPTRDTVRRWIAQGAPDN